MWRGRLGPPAGSTPWVTPRVPDSLQAARLDAAGGWEAAQTLWYAYDLHGTVTPTARRLLRVGPARLLVPFRDLYGAWRVRELR